MKVGKPLFFFFQFCFKLLKEGLGFAVSVLVLLFNLLLSSFPICILTLKKELTGRNKFLPNCIYVLTRNRANLLPLIHELIHFLSGFAPLIGMLQFLCAL